MVYDRLVGNALVKQLFALAARASTIGIVATYFFLGVMYTESSLADERGLGYVVVYIYMVLLGPGRAH